MDRQSEKGSSTHRFSRRTFLRLSGAGLAGGLVGYVGGRLLANSIVEEARLDEGTLLSETITFRESLDLEGLPEELVKGLLEKKEWTTGIDQFSNELPVKIQSYGMRIAEVLQSLCGENAGRLVKGARVDKNFPYGIAFSGGDRKCIVSDSISSMPIKTEYMNFVLHEAGGHGTDPVSMEYPLKMLIKIEHGKWKALSQMLSIEGQFLYNPGDLMFPLLKKKVGETVGYWYVTGQNLSNIFDEANINLVNSELEAIARERGRKLQDLKFNKSVCKELGGKLVSLLRSGKIKFSGDLKKTYQSGMESAGVEIYAEMVKYALVYPDLIKGNKMIVGGISEVFSTIQGRKVSIEKLREAIKNPSKEVLERNASEKVLLEKLKGEEVIDSQGARPLSPEEEEIARKQQEEFDLREKAFNDFVSNGELPEYLEINEPEKSIVVEYAKLYSKIVNKYPMLTDTFASQYNESFDPELNIWEIREIETAMGSEIARTITGSKSLDNQTIEEIQKRILPLEKFVDSPAF
jgi:hypothetical protein